MTKRARKHARPAQWSYLQIEHNSRKTYRRAVGSWGWHLSERGFASGMGEKKRSWPERAETGTCPAKRLGLTSRTGGREGRLAAPHAPRRRPSPHAQCPRAAHGTSARSRPASRAPSHGGRPSISTATLVQLPPSSPLARASSLSPRGCAREEPGCPESSQSALRARPERGSASPDARVKLSPCWGRCIRSCARGGASGPSDALHERATRPPGSEYGGGAYHPKECRQRKIGVPRAVTAPRRKPSCWYAEPGNGRRRRGNHCRNKREQ